MDRVSKRVKVPAELAGKRLDQAAAALLAEFSRSRLKAWIEAGQLTVGGAAARARTRLAGGEELVLEAELEPVIEVAPEPIPISVVHSDADIYVVDKPAGLVVHPGAGNASGTLQNALLALEPALAAVPRAGLVHRLDKDTSGLLVVARNLTAQQRLAELIEQRAVRRLYHAVCRGALSGGGRIDARVGRHPRDRTRMAVTPRGREARTAYRVLERFRAHTYVEAELETGRTHQIRVHFAHIRAPLVGDPAYGGRPSLPKRPTERAREALQGFRRQALHARRLELAHPVTGRPLAFESPLPADFDELLAALRADAAETEGRA